MSKNESLTVHIYKPEYDFLKWLVLQKPDIETGGDLFGLWQDKQTAVVQLILGPGKGCKRTTTSFHQDVNYLKEVGEYLTSSQGLCNIGEWHSHHRLGLPEPSHGDQNTVWGNLPTVAGGRFIVFIANITGKPAKVNVGCFLFDSSQQKMVTGKIKCLPCLSPVRQKLNTTYQQVTSDAEDGQDWETFQNESDFNKFTSNGTIRDDWEAFNTETDESGLITGTKSTEAASGVLSSQDGNVYEENEECSGERDYLIGRRSSGQEKTSWIRTLLRFLFKIFCCCCRCRCCCCRCCDATCDGCECCECCYCKCYCSCGCRCSDTKTNHSS